MILFALEAFVTISIATLLYGHFVSAKQLKLQQVQIQLQNWPANLNHIKIALIADLHIKDQKTSIQATRAIQIALQSNPQILIIGGDIIDNTNPKSLQFLRQTLQTIKEEQKQIPILAILGNHDFNLKSITSPVPAILAEFNITTLQNDACILGGIVWAGIDTATLHLDQPGTTLAKAEELAHTNIGEKMPIITLWHEPDLVDQLPNGSALMLSGHSHGGQFIFPWGWTPMHTDLGRKYPQGYYPNAKTPLYVTRGIGTTGPPARLNCSPEITILTLTSKAPLADSIQPDR